MLEGLIERIERATGPSIVLDRDIALAVYPGAKLVAGCDARISVWDGNGRTQLTVKPYTASLDAAMTLVPEGHYWAINMCGNGEGFDACCQNDGPISWTRAATPALALCAASLRARGANG